MKKELNHILQSKVKKEEADAFFHCLYVEDLNNKYIQARKNNQN